MKKIITTLLILFLSLGLFAETGYQRHQWYSTPGDFTSYGRVIQDYKDTPRHGFVWPIIYKAEIQGESTFVYYCFSGLYEESQIPEFISACFLLSEKAAKEYTKKITQGKSNVGRVNVFDGQYEELDGQFELTEEMFNFFVLTDYVEIIKFIEAEGIESTNKELEKTKKPNSTISHISIYDYNDDTRCYIFENFVPGRTAILFGPHTNY